MARNLLNTAASYLQDKMEVHASIVVLFETRDGVKFEALAIAGQMSPEVEEGGGLVIRTTTHDFTIRQSYFLKFKPHDPIPRRGETITQVVNGRTLVFSVNADGFATSPEEASDAYGVAFRIHTKLETNRGHRCDDWTPSG